MPIPTERPKTSMQIDREIVTKSDAELRRMAEKENGEMNHLEWDNPNVTDEHRYARRASNMLVKRAYEAKLDAERAEKNANGPAAQFLAVKQNTALESFLRKARAAYPGTDAEFETDKPYIIKKWRVQQAVDAGNADIYGAI